MAAGLEVLVKPSAIEELLAVSPRADRRRLTRRMEALAEDPRPPGCRLGPQPWRTSPFKLGRQPTTVRKLNLYKMLIPMIYL